MKLFREGPLRVRIPKSFPFHPFGLDIRRPLFQGFPRGDEFKFSRKHAIYILNYSRAEIAAGVRRGRWICGFSRRISRGDADILDSARPRYNNGDQDEKGWNINLSATIFRGVSRLPENERKRMSSLFFGEEVRIDYAMNAYRSYRFIFLREIPCRLNTGHL